MAIDISGTKEVEEVVQLLSDKWDYDVVTRPQIVEEWNVRSINVAEKVHVIVYHENTSYRNISIGDEQYFKDVDMRIVVKSYDKTLADLTADVVWKILKETDNWYPMFLLVTLNGMRERYDRERNTHTVEITFTVRKVITVQ